MTDRLLLVEDDPRIRTALGLGLVDQGYEVVSNLVDNAEGHGRGLVRVAVCQIDRVVRLEVDDAGPGVPAADRERIFERFARVSDRDRHVDDTGSGLGLALVAQHVRLHSGRVWVTDRPGGGARFVVELGSAR